MACAIALALGLNPILGLVNPDDIGLTVLPELPPTQIFQEYIKNANHQSVGIDAILTNHLENMVDTNPQ